MDQTSKAQVHGLPGERARAMGVMRTIWPLLAALFCCGLFAGAALPQVRMEAAGVGLLLASCFLLWSLGWRLKRSEAFFKGARGEERVAGLLAELPRGYHVFHDFPCGLAWAIDHVVVGPGGLFVIETKCWADKVTLMDGVLLAGGTPPSRPPLRQAREAAQALTGFLSERLGSVPECVAILCFASNTFEAGVARHENVVICNAVSLQERLSAGNAALTADQVERIAKVMEWKAS